MKISKDTIELLRTTFVDVKRLSPQQARTLGKFMKRQTEKDLMQLLKSKINMVSGAAEAELTMRNYTKGGIQKNYQKYL